MATSTKGKRRAASRTPPSAGGKASLQVRMEYRDVSELIDYTNNPRDNSAAIESVANSIRTFGFLVPVVVDPAGVIVAGHTRVAAAKTLNMHEVPVVEVGHLSEDEIRAFRVIDNKVAELAKWDFDLLSGEISSLQGAGLTLTEFGFTREEIDCLADTVAADCLSTEGMEDLSARDTARRTERRAPATARFVCGEIVFFVQASDYRRWVDGIRTLHDYSDMAIVAEIKQRLGITEEAVEAAARTRRVVGRGAAV